MIKDRTTSIEDLKEIIEKFVSDRNWKSLHTPKNLSMSIAIEAAELMEHFQWQFNEEEQISIDNVVDELADILIYCLAFANVLKIDVSNAVNSKLDRNITRYPTQNVNETSD